MWDGQDGAASSEAWIYSLDWPGREGFADAKRHIIRARALREENGCCLCEDSREGATQQAGGSISSGKLQLGGQGQGRLHIELNDRQQQHQQQRWQGSCRRTTATSSIRAQTSMRMPLVTRLWPTGSAAAG